MLPLTLASIVSFASIIQAWRIPGLARRQASETYDGVLKTQAYLLPPSTTTTASPQPPNTKHKSSSLPKNTNTKSSSPPEASPVCIQPRGPRDPSAAILSQTLTSPSVIPNACAPGPPALDVSNDPWLTLYYHSDVFSLNVTTNKLSSPQFNCQDTFERIVKACIVDTPNNGFWGGYVVFNGANVSISNFQYSREDPKDTTSQHPTSPVAGSTTSPGGHGTLETSDGHQTTKSADPKSSVSTVTEKSSPTPTVPEATKSSSTKQSSSFKSQTSDLSSSVAAHDSTRPLTHTTFPDSTTSGRSSTELPKPVSSIPTSKSPTTKSSSMSNLLTSSSTMVTSKHLPESSTSLSTKSGLATSGNAKPTISHISSTPIQQTSTPQLSKGTISLTSTTRSVPRASSTSQGKSIGQPSPISTSTSSVRSKPQSLPTSQSKVSGVPRPISTSLSRTPGTSQIPSNSPIEPRPSPEPTPAKQTTMSTTPEAITSTLTSPPPGMSTDHVTNTKLSVNTWLTTSHDGHRTVVPVLVGCPGCGGVGGGIVVWGFPPIPNVSFQFPKFPDLPSFHLPCVKILGITISGDCRKPPVFDNGGKPGPPKQKPTTSRKSCARSDIKTVSDCSVLCSTVTKSNPITRTTETCSTTCSSTRTGCKTTGTTSTSTQEDDCFASPTPGGSKGLQGNPSRTTCGGACPATLPAIPTTGPLAISLPTEDPGDLQKRTIAGRAVHTVTIVKRGGPDTISKINNCQLATPAGKPVTVPSWPGGLNFWKSESQGKLPDKFKTISRYYVTTRVGCIATVTDLPFNKITPNQQSRDNNDVLSIDHAYEIGWLKKFMQSIISNGGDSLNCKDMNTIFFDPQGDNYMAFIFDGLPSETNPDFVAMSQLLNGDAKGWILGSDYKAPDDLLPQWQVQPKQPWSKSNTDINYKLGTLNYMTLGCVMVNKPNVIDLIKKTNSRIYGLLQQLDRSQASVPQLPRQNFGFAARYKVFMNKLAVRWNSVPQYQADLIKNIETDLKQAKSNPGFVQAEWDSLYTVWHSYMTEYGGANSPAAYNINLNF